MLLPCNVQEQLVTSRYYKLSISTKSTVGASSCSDCSLSPAVPTIGSQTSVLDNRGTEDSCMVRHVFWSITNGGCVQIYWFSTETMAPRYTVGQKQAGNGCIIMWVMFLWNTLGPIIRIQHSQMSGASTHDNRVSSELLLLTTV